MSSEDPVPGFEAACWKASKPSRGKHLLHTDCNYGKVNLSTYRPAVPRGFQEVKVPRLRDSGPE